MCLEKTSGRSQWKRLLLISSWTWEQSYITLHEVAEIFSSNTSQGLTELSLSFTLFLQLKKYYQPRKSHRTVSVILQGDKVPLYGAGAGLALPSTGGTVQLTLNFDIITRGYVVGKLVRVKHHKHVSCPITVDTSKTKPIKFSQRSCTYEWIAPI